MKIDFEFGLLHVWVTILVADLKNSANNRFQVTRVTDYEGHELTVSNGRYTEELEDQIEKYMEAMLPAIIKGERIDKVMTREEEMETRYLDGRGEYSRRPLLATIDSVKSHRFRMTHDEREDAEIGLCLFSTGIYF